MKQQLNIIYAWWTDRGESRHAVMQAPDMALYRDNVKARRTK